MTLKEAQKINRLMPKVSVIIPTYNRAKYILKTLDSVFAQTFNDYEVIVIDDGSTDNTAEVLKPYSGRIVYINKPNGGPASARNAGLHAAKGEYIAFLDSDDLWLPEKLQVQVDFMDSHQEMGLVFSDYTVFREDDQGNRKDYKRKDLSSIEHSFKRLFCGNFIPNLTVMIRKECLDSTGYFDESKELIGIEDYDLWLRISRRYRLGYIPMVISLYRDHEANLIGANLEKMYSLHLAVINKILTLHPSILDELGMSLEKYYRDYYYRSGRNLYQTKRYKSAIKFLKKSLEFKKLSPKALILYGLSWLYVLRHSRTVTGKEL